MAIMTNFNQIMTYGTIAATVASEELTIINTVGVGARERNSYVW
jgi:hypothetical protein